MATGGKNAVEAKLRSKPSDIGVPFREWLTRLKALYHSQGSLIGPWGDWVGCRKQNSNATFDRWTIPRRLHRPRSRQRNAGHRRRENGFLLAALSNRTSRSGDSGGTAHHHREGTKRLPRGL